MQICGSCQLSGPGFTPRFSLLRFPSSLQHYPVAAIQIELWGLGVVERGARRLPQRASDRNLFPGADGTTLLNR